MRRLETCCHTAKFAKNAVHIQMVVQGGKRKLLHDTSNKHREGELLGLPKWLSLMLCQLVGYYNSL